MWGPKRAELSKLKREDQVRSAYTRTTLMRNSFSRDQKLRCTRSQDDREMRGAARRGILARNKEDEDRHSRPTILQQYLLCFSVHVAAAAAI